MDFVDFFNNLTLGHYNFYSQDEIKQFKQYVEDVMTANREIDDSDLSIYEECLELLKKIEKK